MTCLTPVPTLSWLLFIGELICARIRREDIRLDRFARSLPATSPLILPLTFGGKFALRSAMVDLTGLRL